MASSIMRSKLVNHLCCNFLVRLVTLSLEVSDWSRTTTYTCIHVAFWTHFFYAEGNFYIDKFYVIIFDIQICLGVLLFKKYLKMMSIMMIFFNAHAWVYVWWASLISTSLISMHVTQALVKKKKKNLQCLCSPGIGCFKNFQCPCPPGFTNGLKK
jgi:hypothetical protein